MSAAPASRAARRPLNAPRDLRQGGLVNSVGMTQILFASPCGELRQHLQVLVAEQLGVGVALVDGRRRPCRSPRLALGAQDRGGLGALGTQHRGLLLALGVEDLGLLEPSAVRIAARRSRSARICFSIASWMPAGGSTALSSTRLMRIPHLPVASSSTMRSCVLIWSRLVSDCSSVRPPMTLRSVVTVSCSIACSGLATS